MGFGNIRRLESFNIPTNEDRLDVDFWAIVSDCRAIVSGNLVPRPWSELAGAWKEYESDPELHRSYETKKKCSAAAKRVWANRPRPLNKVVAKRAGVTNRKLVRKMARLLELNGMNMWDARMKAREILGIPD